MAKKADQKAITTKMAAMARSWPRPGELVYFLEPDHIWLHKIRLPDSQRGTGTQKICEFLHLCDQLSLPVTLTADPIDDDEAPRDAAPNPTTFDLVRWYQRLGFAAIGPSEDGFVMERPAQSSRPVSQMLQDYKRAPKMSLDEFEKKFPAPPERRSLGPDF